MINTGDELHAAEAEGDAAANGPARFIHKAILLRVIYCHIDLGQLLVKL